MYNLYSPDLGHDDPSSVRSGDAVCGAGGRGDLHNAAGKIIKLNGATEQQPSVQQNSSLVCNRTHHSGILTFLFV